MREFVLTGSYYEMGRQYGHYCRKEIKLFTKAIQIMWENLSKQDSCALLFP